eukprot:8122624-Pyramimonas_sp.AAC.1
MTRMSARTRLRGMRTRSSRRRRRRRRTRRRMRRRTTWWGRKAAQQHGSGAIQSRTVAPIGSSPCGGVDRPFISAVVSRGHVPPGSSERQRPAWQCRQASHHYGSAGRQLSAW